ncbi:MAG: hypothetical protein FJX52_00050 [Alphaproteobacteria bacterium]|nr:hypothetical protein [Alphaproteobacteria bacterium]
MIASVAKLLSAITAITLVALAYDPSPAQAESYFSGSVSVGNYGGRHHRSRHSNFGYGYGYHWGPPVVYMPAPAPRVVYVPTYPVEAPIVLPPVSVAPASPAYHGADGRYCREYQRTVMVGAVAQQMFGTACLGPDGVSRIVN